MFRALPFKNWFKTFFFFTNRTQSVITNDSLSKHHVPLECVREGSVIDLLSFTLYTAPLEDIIKARSFGRMIYTDDTQVYVILKNDSDSSSIITKLERCINDIKVWSSANGFKLNEDKTEVIHMTSRFRNPCHVPFVNFADVPIQPVKSARNFGVIFENDLNRMDTYMNNICRSASYAL